MGNILKIMIAKKTNFFIFLIYVSICFCTFIYSNNSNAQNDNSFEVGTGTIASTFASATFTTFNFATSFSQTPIIFILPSTQGGDECDVRITNVTLTSFDAVCAEAPPRDGEHVAVNIQYIALLPGVTQIPTATGGSVTFEAGTIDTQTLQHNCPAAANCGAEGFEIITPSAVNASNAAILGQIQSLNNETGNVPTTSSMPFLTTAIDATQGAGNEFGLALERNEVDEGSVTSNETIAWLVIEDTNGCEILDFSGRGGPSAVPFQSIVTDDLAVADGGDIHGVPDGFSQGCNAGEGAVFENGCFTNTPVALANKRSRNEEDGGWLRQCGITTTGINVTIDEDRSTDGERNHVAESISVLAFGESFTTPVTLSHLQIKQLNRLVTFEWETSTETLNIGFNLWGKLDDKWEQLNTRLIPSNRFDKLAPSQYKRNIRLSAYQRDQITEFGISSVDVSGKDEFYGPFNAGDTYGEASIPQPIDWQSIKAEFEQRMLSRGFKLIDGRWRKNSTVNPITPTQESRIDILIQESGLYRITYEQIKALGVEWEGVRTREIAVSRQGNAVPRVAIGENGIFGEGSSLEFYATAPQGDDALYTDTNVYQLQLSRALAKGMRRINHAVDDNNAKQLGFQKVSIGENTIYSELTTDDPWMDAELFSYGASSEVLYKFDITSVEPDTEDRLRVSLAGGTDLPGSGDDHALEIYLNDQFVTRSTANGFDRWLVDAALPSNSLVAGENELKLVAPGDTGFDFDLFYIDNIEILNSKVLSHDNAQALQFLAPINADAFKITLESNNRPQRSYVTQPNGNAALISRPEVITEDGVSSLLLPTTALHSEIGDTEYWIGSTAQMAIPELVVTDAQAISITNSDYLIIAHPSFINDELEKFAEEKTKSGLKAQIISWLDIIDTYGNGLETPQALRNFLAIANNEYNYKYILLVGGHSYDYRDYAGIGSINFIPTLHRGINLIQQSPTDTPYADLDGDSLPEKAIGRWPVRTEADLSAIIRKTNEWQTKGLAASRSALFLAEQTEANRDFDLNIENALTLASNSWQDIDKVYLDELVQTNPSDVINIARQSFLDSINSGVGLTVFNGHGSPSSWTFQSLVSSNELQQLKNHGLPTMVMPLACYTTYYQTPSVNSLAHQWLFASQDSPQTTGAVAIHGAMVLGDYRDNALFAEKVLDRQLKRNETIGEAILNAKRSLSPWHHMVNNWALLGDPSLLLER